MNPYRTAGAPPPEPQSFLDLLYGVSNAELYASGTSNTRLFGGLDPWPLAPLGWRVGFHVTWWALGGVEPTYYPPCPRRTPPSVSPSEGPVVEMAPMRPVQV